MQYGTKKATEVVFGRRDDGGDLVWDVDAHGVLVASGFAGSGQDTLKLTLLAHALRRPREWEPPVIISPWRAPARSSLDVAVSEEEIEAVLDRLQARVRAGGGARRIMVTVNDVHVFSEAVTEKLDRLADLARLGRASGIHIAAMVRPESSERLDDELRANSGARVRMGSGLDQFLRVTYETPGSPPVTGAIEYTSFDDIEALAKGART